MPLNARSRRFWWISSLALLLAVAAGGWLVFRQRNPKPPTRRPLLVFGLDGGERRVLDKLWAQGKLPHLRKIADRGVIETLHTAYNASPVIWTTIATGVTPQVHGITDFVVPTPRGDVPVSSDLRRVPALWNMLTRVGRRVAVLGWWGSWPAEEVNGYVLSDRVLLNLERQVYPPSYLPEFQRLAQEAARKPSLFHSDEPAEARDRALARAAEDLAGQDIDLLLMYFRSTDVVSHAAWKCFEPEAFPSADPSELEACRGRVPQVYEAVDEAIGRILDAAPEDANVIVLSDHGFHAARQEEVRVFLDMDAVLEKLGYLKHRGDGSVDFAATQVYTYATADFRRPKRLRFALSGREPGGRVRPEERAGIRERLVQDLAKATYSNGAPVFYLREPRPRLDQGADLVVGVSTERVTPLMLIAGQPFPGAVRQLFRMSGTHTEKTHGIFLAAGPDIDPDARIAGIHVHDMAPTFLYGLGLPVAEGFAGRAWTELYTEEFRRSHPLRTIRSWGVRRQGKARSSAADGELLNELRALGYINR
jgi:predicted AlkP superfamily phosphohydrolase/phosphomutase